MCQKICVCVLLCVWRMWWSSKQTVLIFVAFSRISACMMSLFVWRMWWSSKQTVAIVVAFSRISVCMLLLFVWRMWWSSKQTLAFVWSICQYISVCDFIEFWRMWWPSKQTVSVFAHCSRLSLCMMLWFAACLIYLCVWFYCLFEGGGDQVNKLWPFS